MILIDEQINRENMRGNIICDPHKRPRATFHTRNNNYAFDNCAECLNKFYRANDSK